MASPAGTNAQRTAASAMRERVHPNFQVLSAIDRNAVSAVLLARLCRRFCRRPGFIHSLGPLDYRVQGNQRAASFAQTTI